jgi:hypothetical protein
LDLPQPHENSVTILSSSLPPSHQNTYRPTSLTFPISNPLHPETSHSHTVSHPVLTDILALSPYNPVSFQPLLAPQHQHSPVFSYHYEPPQQPLALETIPSLPSLSKTANCKDHHHHHRRTPSPPPGEVPTVSTDGPTSNHLRPSQSPYPAFFKPGLPFAKTMVHQIRY